MPWNDTGRSTTWTSTGSVYYRRGTANGTAGYHYVTDPALEWTSMGYTTNNFEVTYEIEEVYTWGSPTPIRVPRPRRILDEPGRWHVLNDEYIEPEPSRAERLEREQHLRQERERRREQMQAVEHRTESLLRMVLSSDELDRYDTEEEIVITGSDGRRYMIRDGLMANVYVLDDHGNDIEHICAHPREYNRNHDGCLPTRDAHVGQILALRHDAPGFLAEAVTHWRGT